MQVKEAVDKLDDSINDPNEEIKNLQNQQRRSSAVETIFTFTILIFTLAQVSAAINSNASSLAHPEFILYSAATLFIVAASLSGALGGYNVFSEIKRAILNFKNKVSGN